MADSLKILLHDETQLLDWGESRAGGPWIKLRLKDPEMLDVFRGMDTAKANKSGHILNVTIAQGDIIQLAPEHKERPSGAHIAELYKHGFFFNPKVLAVLGTDDEYRAWVQMQPSCYSGKFSEYIHGEGRCIAAHVRRAKDSGTSYKAEYSCVPLTDEEHTRSQHQHGESSLGGKEFFDKKLANYKNEWAHMKLRELFCVERLSEVSIEAFRAWAEKEGIYNSLPPSFKDRANDF